MEVYDRLLDAAHAFRNAGCDVMGFVLTLISGLYIGFVVTMPLNVALIAWRMNKK